MKRQLLAIALLAMMGLVCAPRPAHAAVVVKVGSFTKSTSTSSCGTATNCNNTVAHGLGVTPQALILWTDGGVTENAGATGYWSSFGVTDGTTSRSTSASSASGVTTSSASRRSAAVVLTIVQYGNVLNAEATFQATNWDATNFYLHWGTNNSSAYIIHFIAIAGLTNAQVLDWTAPASTGTATATLASPQFQPDLVLHFMDYDTVTPPSTVADAAFMLGAMDAGGDSWATSIYAKSGVTTTATARVQIGSSNASPACIEETNSAATETLRGGTCTMTSTGWTVNFTTNSVGAQRVYSLALKGLNVHVGTFNRSGNTGCPAPCNQTITGLGFQPALALFSGFMTTTQSTPVANARIGLGATDNTTEGTTALDDKNGIVTGGSTKTFTALDEFTDAFDVVDNDTGSLFARGHIKSGTGGSFNADGFTIDWTTNSDNVATEVLYIAMGAMSATAVTLESFVATRLPDGKTRLEWRTGYEVDNVGFRVYRQQNGQRVRITSSLVPGTALIGIGRGVSSGGRSYTWSDIVVPPDPEPVQYWLEDIDLHGKSTWHGPILATSSTPRER